MFIRNQWYVAGWDREVGWAADQAEKAASDAAADAEPNGQPPPP